MSELRTGHDSRALGNQIIRLAGEQGRALTIMQLIKLAYFAHGWSLAIRDRPLSKHAVQAWQYGPVFPHLYKSLSGIGSRPIEDLIYEKSTGIPYSSDFSADELDLIKSVVEGYGNAHAFTLSNITHEPGSPWDRVIKQSGPYSEIPNSLIRDYFREQAGAGSEAAVTG